MAWWKCDHCASAWLLRGRGTPPEPAPGRERGGSPVKILTFRNPGRRAERPVWGPGPCERAWGIGSVRTIGRSAGQSLRLEVAVVWSNLVCNAPVHQCTSPPAPLPASPLTRHYTTTPLHRSTTTRTRESRNAVKGVAHYRGTYKRDPWPTDDFRPRLSPCPLYVPWHDLRYRLAYRATQTSAQSLSRRSAFAVRATSSWRTPACDPASRDA